MNCQRACDIRRTQINLAATAADIQSIATRSREIATRLGIALLRREDAANQGGQRAAMQPHFNTVTST